jgi:hypothetical protein
VHQLRLYTFVNRLWKLPHFYSYFLSKSQIKVTKSIVPMATTVSMASADVFLDDMTVERSLHCKYVSNPLELSRELKGLLGVGQYKVEVT